MKTHSLEDRKESLKRYLASHPPKPTRQVKNLITNPTNKFVRLSTSSGNVQGRSACLFTLIQSENKLLQNNFLYIKNAVSLKP